MLPHQNMIVCAMHFVPHYHCTVGEHGLLYYTYSPGYKLEATHIFMQTLIICPSISPFSAATPP